MYDLKRVQLFRELMNYEKKGVSLWMDNSPASPAEIANSEILKEEAAYMRDYIANEEGVIEEIHFNRIGGK